MTDKIEDILSNERFARQVYGAIFAPAQSDTCSAKDAASEIKRSGRAEYFADRFFRLVGFND